MTAPASTTVFIPLTIRKRNGRPKIVPPAGMVPKNDGGVDPLIKALTEGAAGDRLDLGCVAAYGIFSCVDEGCGTLTRWASRRRPSS